MGRTIKNGRFCIYNGNEFKVNRDSDGNTIILTKNDKIMDSTFIDKNGSGVYSKKVSLEEIEELYRYATYAVINNYKVNVEKENQEYYFVGTADCKVAGALGLQRGEFLGNSVDSFESRTLAPHSEGAEIHYYQLVEDYEFTTGKAAPWFGSEGGAQHVLNKENLKIENKIITEMKGKVDLENYISIVNENDVYVVNENHRGSKKVKYTTDNYEKAVIFGIVSYKKLNDKIIDREKVRELRKAVNENDIKFVNQCFDEFTNIFSEGFFQINKICIIKEDEKANVIFNDNKIVEKASLSRAFVAAFNYCKNYQKIIDFCNKYKEVLKLLSIDENDIVNAYMF